MIVASIDKQSSENPVITLEATVPAGNVDDQGIKLHSFHLHLVCFRNSDQFDVDKFLNVSTVTDLAVNQCGTEERFVSFLLCSRSQLVDRFSIRCNSGVCNDSYFLTEKCLRCFKTLEGNVIFIGCKYLFTICIILGFCFTVR